MQEIQVKTIEVDGKAVPLQELIEGYKQAKEEKKFEKKAVQKRKQEQALKPYQAELIKLQKHLEEHQQKMIILFEGRDAAGKGGTIRRVTRYMNEKHYRVVALGKPTEEQRTQWYYQKYVQHFPRAGRWSSSTEAGTTGRWWNMSSASAPPRSTKTS